MCMQLSRFLLNASYFPEDNLWDLQAIFGLSRSALAQLLTLPALNGGFASGSLLTQKVMWTPEHDPSGLMHVNHA